MPTSITIDWQNLTGKNTKREHFGINQYQYSNPDISQQANYKAGISYMNPGFFRLCNVEQVLDSSIRKLGWVISPTTAAYAWDVPKITRCLNDLYTMPKMMNITNWVSYMNTPTTNRLKPEMYQNYANFCADLVRIINIDLGKGIKYWEVTNELDHPYNGAYAELGIIFNLCYDAMKAVDPSIKIGGAAFANAYDYTDFGVFIETVKNRIDFVSYHTYNGVNSTTTKQVLYKAAEALGSATSWWRGKINQVIPSRASQIELSHNEYNMARTATSATWLHNATSVIYNSLAAKAIINAGVDTLALWNEADGWWGALNTDAAFTKRPVAHLISLFNLLMVGQVVQGVSSDPVAVESFIVKNPVNGYKNILLINKSTSDQQVNLVTSNWENRPSDSTFVYSHKIDNNGYLGRTTTNHATLRNGFTIPADSVIFLQYRI